MNNTKELENPRILENANLPKAPISNSVIAWGIDEKLLVIWDAGTRILVYIISLDIWLEYTVMGSPSNKEVVVAYEDKLAVLTSQSEIYVLDLEKMHWNKIPPQSSYIPWPRNDLTGWHWNDKLWFFGGCDKSVTSYSIGIGADIYYKFTNELISFDLKTHQWQLHDTKGIIPTPRKHHVSTKWGKDKIIVYGGDIDYSLDDYSEKRSNMHDIFLLDMPSLSWCPIESYGGEKPECRKNTICKVLGEKVYIQGGRCGSYYWAVNMDFWALDTNTWQWEELHIDKPCRYNHAGAVIQGKLYIYGGISVIDQLPPNQGHRTSMMQKAHGVVTLNDLIIYEPPNSPKNVFTLTLSAAKFVLEKGLLTEEHVKDLILPTEIQLMIHPKKEIIDKALGHFGSIMSLVKLKL